MIEPDCIDLIAAEIRVRPEQVIRAVNLLDEGATIPFIARYRKDLTGNLNEEHLEAIAERNQYFTDLAMRRKTVLDALEKQGKLTDDLRTAIAACRDRRSLEDIYAPYKKARRTKATVAREKGLEPLADFLQAQDPAAPPIDEFAQQFVRPERAVHNLDEAIDGARHILAERVALDPALREALRKRMLTTGKVVSKATQNAEKAPQPKLKAYTDFSEAAATIPSHRFLAIQRGAKEGMLRVLLEVDDAAAIEELRTRFITAPGSQYESHWNIVVEDAYHRLLRPSIENDVLHTIQERADREAINVFRQNAENLLLSPPAGAIAVLGVDPGFKNGCKLAVVDANGAFVESAVIYPHPPQSDATTAEAVLLALMQKHPVRAIAVGNGTAARETNAFVRGVLERVGLEGAFCVLVNESGASIYSASKTARDEFPDLDITIRGAISIARRLQDPLAELVKIDPRHIGVGQYQHDVNQKWLREGLALSVASCVNRVGVDVNTASAPLLRHVSGLRKDTAEKVIAKRTALGGFKNRQQLLEVDGIGPAIFEQAAGFLRVQGDNPLDRTGIHPEAYGVVEQVATRLNCAVADLIQNAAAIEQIDWSEFESDTIGAIALADIRRELAKPQRDPRASFRAPRFLEGVTEVKALEEGMEAEGVVTNVTDFGAFVDIGVHQDGLVHLSELSHRFVRDPHSVVRVGQIVKVKVIGVDKDAPRISLSIKALQSRETKEGGGRRRRGPRRDAQSTAPEAAPLAQERPRQAAPKDARQERPPRNDQPRRDRNRPHEKPGRPRRNEGAAPRHDREQQPATQKQAGSFNTELADQLAALKDKLGGR